MSERWFADYAHEHSGCTPIGWCFMKAVDKVEEFETRITALEKALRSVAPNWDAPTGYCWCSQDAFHDDDGERIKHDGDHEPACAQARKLLGIQP